MVANRAAVGAAADSIRFTANHNTVNHVAAADEVEGTVEVPVATLDQALTGTSANGPMLIKIDVEDYDALTRRLSALPGRNGTGSTIYLGNAKLVEQCIAAASRFDVQGRLT